MNTNFGFDNNLEKFFVDYAIEVLKKSCDKTCKIESRKCNDICCGCICNSGCCLWVHKDKRLKKQGKLSPTNNQNIKTIVVVLESPHVSEYNDANCIGPALGKTGENLENYLEKALRDAFPIDQKYYIVLMNSIQYQCSLGVQPAKKYRDEIWPKMWSTPEVRADFINRLKSYNPSIIVNCCTLVNLKDKVGVDAINGNNQANIPHCNSCCKSSQKFYTLRDFVSDEIQKNLVAVKLYMAFHPSSWFAEKNRIIRPV